jgi:hypothetical protein
MSVTLIILILPFKQEPYAYNSIAFTISFKSFGT